jgi:hypothetical protein
MPPKDANKSVAGGAGGDVATSSPANKSMSGGGGCAASALGPPVSPSFNSDGESSSGSKRSAPPLPDTSPKRIVRNIVNVSIQNWMERCPDGSPAGLTGSGNTYAVILEMGACVTVLTKKDQRKVAKKTIVLGDCSSQQAELTIWGNFAARSWTFPEGSVLLFKNIVFSSYYKSKMQLKFADADAAVELLITRAPDSLEITKQLRTWCVFSSCKCCIMAHKFIRYSASGTCKKISLEEVARKPRNHMVFIITLNDYSFNDIIYCFH